LNEKYRWAHSLLDQKLFDVALPELRDIGRTDPGYPGINLDISTALLGTKHAEEAKDAVNAQIAISDCLSKLAPIKVDAYCRTEYSQLSSESCRPRLGQIRQTAELQAAIVHLELGHGVDPDPGPAPATAAVAKVAPAPEQMLPRTSAKPKHATIAVSRPAPEKKLGDKSLMEGEGTDSELGAYSRPQ
jgi:hypothetical protein